MEFLPSAIAILFLALSIVSFIIVIMIIIKVLLRIFKKILADKILFTMIQIAPNFVYDVFIFISILIVFISSITNIGWLHILYSGLIMLHIIIYYYITEINRIMNGKFSKLIHIAISISFSLMYIVLPDGGDTDDSIHGFFGLVENRIVLNIFSIISVVILIFSILAFITILLAYNRKKHLTRLSNN